ncbi:MAG: NFACT family protein [Candidatus Thermoplasmatota archaeon]|nr:NFACT family protein [Candidatus Thermoplasmatota archaeon]
MTRGLASFDIHVIVSESQDLIGCFIEKIYQLTRDELLLRIQQKSIKQKESLFIRNGELLCRTQESFDVPEKPSLFAMTLRKYLLNGKISEITQHEFDRIIKIKIGRKEGEYTLVCELFSKGNIILLDPEGRIIRPLIKQEWASRLIKSGELYIPPPSQTNPFHLTKQAFDDLVSRSSKDLVRTLASSVNLSGLYAEELCAKANIEKNLKASALQKETQNNLYEGLQDLLRVFEEKRFQPVFVKQDATLIDILPFPFVSYTGMEFEPTSSFSRGLELFIHEKKIPKPQEVAHTKQRERLLRQHAQQQELIEEFKESISLRKLEADLIYLNFQTCEKVLGEIVEVLKQKEKEDAIEKIRQNPAVRQFDPTANELLLLLNDVSGKTIEVALDFRKSVTENAEQKYGESKKIQEKLRGAEEAIQQTRHALETLKESEVVVMKKQRTHEKHWWFERFRWFISSEENIVVAGKDASSNDIVVKKYLSEGDRYAHADIHGAPSCVIKSKGIDDEKRFISEKTLEEACLFAASYSRAWNQFAEASVYWVLPEQVSKTPESGEYVPKGAFIIRGKRNYHRCKLEVAVGRIRLGDEERLMGGPVSAVAAHAINGYAILIPGVTKKSTVARILAEAFQVSTDIVEKVLPPGECTILKTIGFELR